MMNKKQSLVRTFDENFCEDCLKDGGDYCSFCRWWSPDVGCAGTVLSSVLDIWADLTKTTEKKVLKVIHESGELCEGESTISWDDEDES